MPEVDIRWRRSGGRGEYEHLPQEILLGRKLVISAISVPGAYITTDVWGRIRDGKPRLRRENPSDHSILNVAPLIAALALFPNPRREDNKELTLPLQTKSYVVSQIRFNVELGDDSRAICTPLNMNILHDNDTIDLLSRLKNVGAIIDSAGLSGAAKTLAARYKALVQGGSADAELMEISEKLAPMIFSSPQIAEVLEAPSEEFVPDAPPASQAKVTLTELSATEAERKLVSHYRIERSDKLRKAKVDLVLKKHGKILCENCEFSFEKKYGARGKGFIEVHHIQPLAALLPNVVTKLSDLMLLCSNCHRMVHRKKPLLTPEALKATTFA